MSILSAVNSSSYSVSALTGAPAQAQNHEANFAAYLNRAEETAEAAAPAITNLLGGGISSSVALFANAFDEDEYASEDSAADEFREFSEMSSEERIFATMLGRQGLTKEEFDSLPPDEKHKLEQEIKDEMQKIYEQRITTGKSATSSHEDFAEQSVGAASQSREQLFG